MNRRDFAINGVLLIGIAIVAWLLVNYRPPQWTEPDKRLPDRSDEESREVWVAPPTPGDGEVERVAEQSLFVRRGPFDTIIEAPPPPPPPPKSTPVPPKLQTVMGRYELHHVDPTRRLLVLQEKSGGALLEWTVGDTKPFSDRGQTLAVTLSSVDRRTFEAELTTSDGQVFKFEVF